MVLSLTEIADLAPETIRPLSRLEYDRLVAEGMFEGERVELLGGVLVAMTPQYPVHSGVVQRLNRVLMRALGSSCDVRVQLPLAVSDDSEPEPDLAVVPLGDTDDAHPRTAFLVVEVSNASVAKDRTVKASLYAAADVPEYWLVNVADGQIEVHVEPRNGRYGLVAIRRPGETISLRAFPDVAIAVDDVLRRR